MDVRIKLPVLTALAALIGGCGGGGGGDNGVVNPPPPTTTTGVFVDSATQGIAYTCGSTTGLTDAKGTFSFAAGDNCTFKVGGITLGSAKGKSVISPVDLVAGATSEADAIVTNIAQFLISLDNDNNPGNGIVIDPAVQTAMAGQTLDFTQATAAFQTAAQTVVDAAIPGRTLVSQSTAQSHLGATLVGLFAGNYSCSYTGTTSGSVTVSIDNGVVTGSGQSNETPPVMFSVDGNVSSIGDAALDVTSGGTSTGATWSGSFRPDGTGSGQWSEPPDDSGTWSCTKTLSTTQANYESIAMAANGGVHDVVWAMPATGLPAAAAGDFIVDIGSSGLTTSPLTQGTQASDSAWMSLANALPLPTLPINLSVPTNNPVYVPTTGHTWKTPDRVVQNGAVVVVSSAPTTKHRVSYVGSKIQIDTLAIDGATVAYSNMVSAVDVVPVAQQAIAAPSDATIAKWLDTEYLIANAANLLKPSATFAAGAAYAKFTATRSGDTLFTGDCTLRQTTISTAMVACQTGETLGGSSRPTESNFADGTAGGTKVWDLANEGTICEIAAQAVGTNCPPFGVRYWVASTPSTSAMNIPAQTTQYRVYYELNGSIYTGHLQKSGAQVQENLGSNAAPDMRPYYIRVNKAFVQSLQSALAF